MDNTYSFQDRFNFVKAVGETFSPLYTHFLNKYSKKQFSEENRQWQLIRRGRYVEFNLVYDKGTKFGLETNGRIESILMSLPPHSSWPYNYTPGKDSPEEKTINLLKMDIDWLK